MLEEGIAFNVRKRGTSAQEPQRGADVTETDAERAQHPHRAFRPGRYGPGRVQRQAASNVREPSKSWHSSKSANRGQPHQPASNLLQACSPDISLEFKQSCPASMRAIRLQLRCNPDSHKDDAYTSFGYQENNAAPGPGSRGRDALLCMTAPLTLVASALVSFVAPCPSNLQFGEADGHAPV